MQAGFGWLKDGVALHRRHLDRAVTEKVLHFRCMSAN